MGQLPGSCRWSWGACPSRGRRAEVEDLTVLCALRQACVVLPSDASLSEALEVRPITLGFSPCGRCHYTAMHSAMPAAASHGNKGCSKGTGCALIRGRHSVTCADVFGRLQAMDEAGESAALVTDEAGSIVGLLTRASVSEALSAAKALENRPVTNA